MISTSLIEKRLDDSQVFQVNSILQIVCNGDNGWYKLGYQTVLY